MKYIKLLLLPLLAAALFHGCEEMPVQIPELSVGDRKVLVEELTGVRCPNCPDGTATLTALSAQLGDNLVVVSIHAAPGYDAPYPENKYDFRTPDGTAMANFIGQASFFPTASIDRRIVPPETEPYLPRQMWPGVIAEELDKAPVVSIFMESEFDTSSRRLDITVKLALNETLSGEHRLTVLITQDSIQDVQKYGLQIVPDYYHRHVLRDVITQATGDVISEPLNASAVVEKKFSLTLPAEWDAKHCSVVAFVHHGTDPDKEVLQVEEKHVME